MLPAGFSTPRFQRFVLWPIEYPLKMLREEESQDQKNFALVTAIDKRLEQGIILEEHPCPVDAHAAGTDAGKCICRIMCKSCLGEH